MRRTVKFLATTAAIALISSACGGDNQSGTTTSEQTSQSVPSTTATADTESPTTAEPTTTAGPTTTAEPTTTAQRTVTVYFSTGDGSDCAQVSPFVHTVQGDGTELVEAVTALLAGPSDADIAAGASSFFSRETSKSLAGVSFSEPDPDLAIIDFQDLQALIPNASTSCGSEALLAQLNQTVLQHVPRVRYEMLHSCNLFAGWLQRECMNYTSEGAEPAVLTTLERAAGSGCGQWGSEVLDGRWFGYVDSSTESEIRFDLACWFDGDAAVSAATEDGEESPPPNDYYIRNSDNTLESVPVAPAITVSWLTDLGDPTTQSTGTIAEWIVIRQSRPSQPGVWLKVRDGQVVEISEQYVP